MIRKIRDNIYSVGAIDKDVRLFHGYEVPQGTSYNSYLIIDEKITLVDNVKAPFTNELIANIEELVPVDKIDYIITNHIEPDHSGSLPEVLKRAKNAQVILTFQAVKGIEAYYGLKMENHRTVKGGDTLSTGKYTFQFHPMPMVHWPDSMATYLVEEEILFSNDAFGQHYYSEHKFSSEIDSAVFFERVADYYGNIVLPYGMQVQKVLEALGTLKISLILPSHGVMIDDKIKEIVEKYSQYASHKCDENKAVVVFDSMWGSTRILAEEITKKWRAEGKEVEVFDLGKTHYSAVMGPLLQSKFLAVGSPTLNRKMMPTVAAFINYLQGLNPKNRTAKAFGSYGWGGESLKEVENALKDLGYEMEESLKCQWKP